MLYYIDMKNFLKNKYVYFVLQCFVVALGAFIMGIAIRSCYTPNNITPSGFTGLSVIIADLLKMASINISPSIIYIIINVALFVLAIVVFGFRYAALTTVGILAYSLFIDVAYIPGLPTNEPLLMAIIGGAIFGFGAGFVFRFGGSTGGSDIIVTALNKRFPKIKTGQCSLIINGVVLVLTIIMYGLNQSLYTVIAIFVASVVTDFILNGVKTVRAIYIICTKDEEISHKLMKRFGQGVTKIDAEGMYSHQGKKVLLCLVSTYQAPFVKQLVLDIEPDAIAFSTTVTEAIGEKAFLKPKTKEKIKWVIPTTKSKKQYKRKDIDELKQFKNMKKKIYVVKNAPRRVNKIDFDEFELDDTPKKAIIIKESKETKKQ